MNNSKYTKCFIVNGDIAHQVVTEAIADWHYGYATMSNNHSQINSNEWPVIINDSDFVDIDSMRAVVNLYLSMSCGFSYVDIDDSDLQAWLSTGTVFRQINIDCLSNDDWQQCFINKFSCLNDVIPNNLALCSMLITIHGRFIELADLESYFADIKQVIDCKSVMINTCLSDSAESVGLAVHFAFKDISGTKMNAKTPNLTTLSFPKIEQQQLCDLNKLFKEWYQVAEQTHFESGRGANDIVFDGFYPHYSQQQYKVLFVGRESLGLTGEHYLDTLYECYSNGYIGDKSLNQHQFHALMFYIAYGLNNGLSTWEALPMATEIAESFACDGGTSFAFMNLSKFSNESEDWSSDWSLIDDFTHNFSNPKCNFFNKEIEIINPDIIVTMNLEERLQALGEVQLLEETPNAFYYKLACGGRHILLIDLYHFAAVKKHKETFYEPVTKGVRKYLNK